MNLTSLHYLILAGVVGLVFKIIWDWLLTRGARRGTQEMKKNGEHTAEVMEHVRTVVDQLNERQQKIWDRVNRGD